MTKRKVPSGLKRASGMLMSPVGPAFARVDTPHAIVPIQDARKRRMTPCEMDTLSRSTPIVLEARAPVPALAAGGDKKEGEWWFAVCRFPRTMRVPRRLQKQQNPAKATLAGCLEILGSEKRLVARATR